MSTTVDAGQSYNFSYTIGNYYSTDDIGVWIDWNQNDIFTDPGENVICAYSVPSAGNYTILVPEDAPDGATRMRVRIKYYNNNCGSPCGTTTYGEVEDYTIVVNSSPYNWLTVSPMSGTISGHDEMPVTLTFNSEGLAEGDYHANVKINSNDPDEPQVILPCTLLVTDQINIDLTAMLEGPYSASEMQTLLNDSAILPFNQPFNSVPWNYSGTESVTSIPNANVVDWVLVELRQTPGDASSATSATMVGREAAFILKDGSIVDLDGVSVLRFDLVVNQNLYAVVYHRNHLGIMSANPLVKLGGNYLLDFSTGAGQAHGGISAQKEVVSNVWALFSGDGNGDGTIDINDKVPDWQIQSGNHGFMSNDYNMDGQVNNLDKDDCWVPNSSKNSLIPE
jgi:hypothetical protein